MRCFKTQIFILSLLVVLSVPLSAYAYFDNFCPDHTSEVKIENRVLKNRLKYVHTRSFRFLGEGDEESREGNTLGMFSRRIMDASSVETIDSDKDGCFERIVVNVSVDFEPFIYIAAELKTGTPAYNYVFWHESEHARITIENNKRYLPYLEQELKRYISGIQTFIPENEKETEASRTYIQSKITAVTNENIDKLNEMIDKVNEAFDEKEHKYDMWLDEIIERLERGLPVTE